MFKKIGSNLFRSRARVSLTAAGIAVGVFSVVLISAIGSIGEHKVSGILADMGINSVLVQSKETFAVTNLNNSDVELITRINGVDKAMPLMAADNQITVLSQNIKCFTWGINHEAKEIISLEAKYGRLINDSDVLANDMVCVIDEDIATQTYGRGNIVGKTVKLIIDGTLYDFKVIGVASSGISTLQSALSNIIPSFVYIPITTMQFLTGRSTYDKIAVLVDDNVVLNDTDITKNIETKLKNIYGSDEYIASNLLQQKGKLEDLMGLVTMTLSIIAGISLFVSGLTIMTTMLAAVGERKREIGIKKSVGAKNIDIMKEFLAESTFLSLIGSLTGAVFAVIITFCGCIIMNFDFTIEFIDIILPIAISVVMGVLFGVYPAAKAAKLPPIEALRY